MTVLLLCTSLASSAWAVRLVAAPNDGIHLAVSPKCGTLAGAPADVNAGLLPLSSYKTIVTFGVSLKSLFTLRYTFSNPVANKKDSYTDGGVRNGGPLLPAVITPPSPKAGGRSTNGPVWAEGLASDVNATLKDYAVAGAVTDAKHWPSKSTANDLVTQVFTVQLFLSQSNNLNPATTLYSVFFSINDVSAAKKDGTVNLAVAAQSIIDKITLLTQPPTNARHFLVLDDYGYGSSSAAGDAFKQQYFTGLQTLTKSISGFKVAFVDFKTLWNGVLGTTPGYAAFGYKSKGSCTLNSSTIVGACSDPDHTFYWIPNHPSKQTHRIMADYIEKVLVSCKV